ncbi:MAG: ATP phosphoribosyltransferase regulatory subunit, partial [Thermoleophilaceae bacterium]|nr:ATP phosphoribosyltransferase regulatory subunit [Thermoleophilaceae bacterium]
MTHPIPPGTRDVLPDEMRELRALTDRMRAAFDRARYGEIHTPALEYEDVLRLGDERAAGAAYRLFDEHGAVLALRSDATIPIARVVASRYQDAEPPLRFCYFTHSYRAVDRGVGESREFLQGGLELIGDGGAEGEAEVVTVMVAALEEAGLRRHRLGVGDSALYRRLLHSFGVREDRHTAVMAALSQRDLVGLEFEVGRLGLPAAERDELLRVPEMRGGREVIDRAGGP